MAGWVGVVRLREPARVSELARRCGGEAAHDGRVVRVVPIERAGEGDLAPLLAPRFVRAAEGALARGASVLVDRVLAGALPREGVWVHTHAAWALASVLDDCDADAYPVEQGEGTLVGPGAVLCERVILGRNVTVGAGAVVGAPGFGWATGPEGQVRRIPQLGGVVIEDDVAIGPLCTIDAGTLSPTVIRRGAKIDAQVHVGHNVDIGEGTMVAAQVGFAGSVRVGRGVLIGGQAGFADHVTVGDGARVAAKSGVIGDVPPGAVVAGYPAVARARWLRALARSYRR